MDAIFTEQDILAESLQGEKHTLVQCAALMGESSCQELRSILSRQISETQQLQFEIAHAMKNRGWLDREEVSKPKMIQVQERLLRVKNQL